MANPKLAISLLATKMSTFVKLKSRVIDSPRKVVWHVLDNGFNFTKNKHEWKGTDVIFEVSKKGDKTEVRVRHRVWFPRTNRFDVCFENKYMGLVYRTAV